MTISLSQVASVVLVLAVVYYIMSMIVSGVTKWVLELFETRGKILEDFLKNNLVNAASAGKKFSIEELKKLPQINSLRPVRYAAGGLGRLFGKTKLSDRVERIEPKVLVDALFDLEGTAADWRDKVKNVIGLLPDSIPNINGEQTPFETKSALEKIVDQNYYTFDQWREKLETHFGSVMDQAAQQFGALAKTRVLWFSLILAFALGVDSIQIAGRAWYDPQLTKKADTYAQSILQSEETQDEQQADLEALYGTLDDMAVINLPWAVQAEAKNGSGQTETTIISYPWYVQPPLEANSPYQDLVSPYTKWSLSQPYGLWLLLRLLGLIITGIAVSQGSSFWYDIIRQIKGEQKKADAATGETPGAVTGEIVQAQGGYYAPPPPPRDEEPPRE